MIQLGADLSVKKIEITVTRSLNLFSLGPQLSVKLRMTRVSSTFSAAIQVSVKVLEVDQCLSEC